MAIIEVNTVYYKNKSTCDRELKYRVSYKEHVLGLFYALESAEKFTSSEVCLFIIRHIEESSSEKKKLREIPNMCQNY